MMQGQIYDSHTPIWNGFNIPDGFWRSALDDRNGPKILLLPFATYIEGQNNEGADIEERPSQIKITPLMRLCYGLPITVQHLWLQSMNADVAFRGLLKEKNFIYPSGFVQDFAGVEALCGAGTQDYDYVIDGVLAPQGNTEDDLFFGIRIWNTKTKEIAFEVSSHDYKDVPLKDALNCAFHDLTIYFVEKDGAVQIVGDYQTYYEQMLNLVGIRQLTEMYFYLYELRCSALGIITYEARNEDVRDLIAASYSMASQMIEQFDLQMQFYTTLNYAAHTHPDIVEEFKASAIELTFQYDGIKTMMEPAIYSIYKLFGQHKPAALIKEKLEKQCQETLGWIS
ncbi:MAG: hypothetical protein QF692_03530 [Alphaproteobacteria bacterium]|nr:hypothetical protein [Alphaproteobacteria bacterium]MDP7222316.1 hypothetical protein [Alphaproteobacteria bacterium]